MKPVEFLERLEISHRQYFERAFRRSCQFIREEQNVYGKIILLKTVLVNNKLFI